MEANLAVLIDFENIAAGTEKEGLGRFDVDALMKRVKDKGRILVARSYADWGRFARFKQSLLTANVSMYELTSHGMQDKNRADIAMVVDALELAFTKDYIDTFVVVSGDSDFTPLVLKMRELNKRVIGCGTRSSTSRLLIQACDEFFFYDSIVRPNRERPPASSKPASSPGPDRSQQMPKHEVYKLLVEALEGLQRENPDPPLASVVKTAMLRKSPDFAENDYGHSSFARFLETAQEAGKVKVVRDRKSGGYRVDTFDSPDVVDFAGHDDDDDRADRRRGRRKTTPAGEAWQDPYLPEGVNEWVEILTAEGLNPLASPSRKAVLQAFEEVVADRTDKKRRVNVQFVQEDVRRLMKKSHPDVPARAIKAVFNALMRANVLIHKDGTPIRTGSAPFGLEKDAEQLNTVLLNVYLAVLHDQDADLSDVDLLAELFLGDRERRRDVEETLAWLDAAHVPGGDDDEDEEEPEDIDLDALLSFDEPVEKKAETKKADDKKAETKKADDKKAEAKKPEAKKAEAKKADDKKSDESAKATDAVEAKAVDAEEAPKKKAPRKRTRKPKAETEGEAKTEAKTEAAADEAPKAKRPRSRTTKKTEPDDDQSLDALLEVSSGE